MQKSNSKKALLIRSVLESAIKEIFKEPEQPIVHKIPIKLEELPLESYDVFPQSSTNPYNRNKNFKSKRRK